MCLRSAWIRRIHLDHRCCGGPSGSVGRPGYIVGTVLCMEAKSSWKKGPRCDGEIRHGSANERAQPWLTWCEDDVD
jgi:hypothetical protein